MSTTAPTPLTCPCGARAEYAAVRVSDGNSELVLWMCGRHWPASPPPTSRRQLPEGGVRWDGPEDSRSWGNGSADTGCGLLVLGAVMAVLLVAAVAAALIP